MTQRPTALWIAFSGILLLTASAWAQQAGSIRGVIYDGDFDVPLIEAKVTLAETGQVVIATEQGNYFFPEVPPGQYTLVFNKDGYGREVIGEVVVSAGQITEVDATLGGEFTDMEEFVVQELKLEAGSEAELLELRADSPSMIDAVGADQLSLAGAGDAADALTLVAGTTVADGKFAVVRGLPDRFVSSQINGMRLPSADEDTRAVELDQFPSDVIESVQVSKTFTPDQQGDASGGAVNVVLTGIPSETFIFDIGVGYEVNTQAIEADFLGYNGGGINFFGEDSSRGIPDDPEDFSVAGVSYMGAANPEYNWNMTIGGKHEFDNGITVGGLANIFYERDVTFFDNGVEENYWMETSGGLEASLGTPLTPVNDPDREVTELFAVTEGSQSLNLGGLGTVGVEMEGHELTFVYLHTRTTEDTATLAEDTQGLELFGYPRIRLETISYNERLAETMQLNGRHTIPTPEFGIPDLITILQPEFDWTLARSKAESNEPDKRTFGSQNEDAGVIVIIPGVIEIPFGGTSNYTPILLSSVGNFNRIDEKIVEESDQYSLNLKFPFRTEWTGKDGYIKVGMFNDDVVRKFNQRTATNAGATFDTTQEITWEEFLSEVFPTITTDTPVVDLDIDVAYRGEQEISAWYYMMDLPVTEWLSLIGGARYESTRISITNDPEADAIILVAGGSTLEFTPEAADVDFEQDDVLPAVAFVLTPIDEFTIRGSYTQTIARQTFKELSPVQQQEFFGGPLFAGNPSLQPAALKNYDLRADWTPYEGSLFSISWFRKDIKDSIELVQQISNGVTFRQPVNFPSATMEGWEFELRQELGELWDPLEGLALGFNYTMIDSEVRLTQDEEDKFEGLIKTREMINAPERLLNLNLTYNNEPTGTKVGLFYTIKGDTLVAGAGSDSGNFIPSIYATEYDTLNFSISQKIGEYFTVTFKAKNLTNPTIKEVYRSDLDGSGDVTSSSYTKGIDLSIGVKATIEF